MRGLDGHVAAMVLLVGMTGSGFVRAEDDTVEVLIARGIELREHGKDDEALPLFRDALARSGTARARAQVALAEQALGLWVVAEADLLISLGSTDPWIEKHRSALEGALEVVQHHLGTLEIRGADGAEVVLDGTSLGRARHISTFRVEPGRRTLEIRGQGSYPMTRIVEIPAAGIARESVTLGTLAKGADPKDAKATTSDGGGQRLLGWSLLATGGALLLTGGIGLFVRKGFVDAYNEKCPGLGASQPPDCEARVESARTWLTVSIVTFVSGGVFALGGAAFLLTAPKPSSVAVACGIVGSGAVCSAKF